MLFILCVVSLLFSPTFLSPVQNDPLFKHIDDHKQDYIQRLKEWVAIESDSSDPSKRDQVEHMMQVTKDYILKIGGKVEMVELGDQEYSPGVKIPMPSVILAEFGNDKTKPTVCFYGHMDVQPAKKDDGWETDPYFLTEKDGNLFGRGTSDDKGQVLALLHAVESVIKFDLPVNVKLFIEGMEEVGSDGLDKIVEDKKDTFFSNVDYIVVTDTPWLSTKPGITYGARGNCYFFIEVEGARRDLHSGGFGGTVYEAMSDLVYLLGYDKRKCKYKKTITWIYRASVDEKKRVYIQVIVFLLIGSTELAPGQWQPRLIFNTSCIDVELLAQHYQASVLADVNGKILIPGVYDDVLPVTEQEKELYKDLIFDLEDMQRDTGVKKFQHSTKEDLLMYRWRFPSLSIHGIEGAFSGSGTKTVIPAKVIGKFSIRQVPNMNPSVVEKQVSDYLEGKFAERKSPNKMKVTMVIGAQPWLANMSDPQYLAARNAVRRVFNVDADMIRAGGTIPIAKNFEEVLGKSVMLLGIGGPDDAPHGQNEKISMYNYIEGTKLYASFLQELASI